ncbi:MAG: T9SS type A sorting domain-containing protein [Ignavibacteriales bacterium]|nr:T9SS type A sorting domain-containing protein [Ignavibacteriales bacterium]
MNFNGFKAGNMVLLFFLYILFFGITDIAFAQQRAVLSIGITPASELVVVVQASFHSDYGCMYPLTYQFDIPQGSSGLKVWKKNFSTDTWKSITEKTVNDFFNGIEAVRFDYPKNRAYVSVAFSVDTDSLLLEITDSNDNTIFPLYAGISKYYDNRRSAVTVTADDWQWASVANWGASQLVSLFRSYNLYVTVGVISDFHYTDLATWSVLQRQVDSGFVEVAAHSRNHLHTPYADPTGEINGCYDDIVNHLTLSEPFRRNSKEYVYAWIAPYGEFDHTTDSILTIRKYLIPRLYQTGYMNFSAWNDTMGHFEPCNPTLEIGVDTNLATMNAIFALTVRSGAVYHIMWHPQTLYNDRNKSYLINHLSNISNHKDVLYANFGHLYLYHLIQQANINTTVGIDRANNVAFKFELKQNYPNPFNPSTTILYNLSKPENVTLEIFDALGRQVKTVLRDMHQSMGQHQVIVDMGDYSSGVYFYELKAGNHLQMKPMVLLK